MAEEKKTEAAQPEAPARPSRLLLVVIPAVVFLVSAAASSYLLGVFAEPPAPPAAEVTESADSPTGEAPNPMAKQPTETYPAGSLGGSVAQAADNTQTEAEESAWLAAERKRVAEETTALESKRRELQLLKQDIEKLLARVEEAKSERIAMMAKLYDNMDAEAVARQIGSMDDRTVITLLPQMNTRTAAKIMALLEPKRAAQITTKLLALDQ